jgi:N-acetylmuramoyl-L-alanine amidase
LLLILVTNGGSDPGAVGPTKLEEADCNLTICNYLADYLETFLGLHVEMTREEDIFIELETRCNIANDWGADYFVSIHCNSDGPEAVGVETLYSSDAGEQLAIPVHETLVLATGDRDRGLKYRDDLYVLNGTNMPAILVEIGFISHPETEQKFWDLEYLRNIANAIGRGIGMHLNLPPPSPA